MVDRCELNDGAGRILLSYVFYAQERPTAEQVLAPCGVEAAVGALFDRLRGWWVVSDDPLEASKEFIALTEGTLVGPYRADASGLIRWRYRIVGVCIIINEVAGDASDAGPWVSGGVP